MWFVCVVSFVLNVLCILFVWCGVGLFVAFALRGLCDLFGVRVICVCGLFSLFSLRDVCDVCGLVVCCA